MNQSSPLRLWQVSSLPFVAMLFVGLVIISPNSTRAQALGFGAPAPLNGHATTDTGLDFTAHVATDGSGNWVAVWQSNDWLGNTINIDRDILFARSTDNGATWSAALPLNTNATTDSGDDFAPRIATDGVGNWVTVWHSEEDLGGTIGSDAEIFVARSTDNGATWTAPAVMNDYAATDIQSDTFPRLATDAAGNWITVWSTYENIGGTSGSDGDIAVSRSTDNGATWTTVTALNTNAATDSGVDFDPVIVAGGAGTWVAAWVSFDNPGFTLGPDSDLLFARSTDNGLTWSAPTPLNTNATSDGGNPDDDVELATDGAGNWVAVWQEGVDQFIPPGTTLDSDLYYAYSSDDGVSWSAPAALNSFSLVDTAFDEEPFVMTDGSGDWVVVWSSTYNLGGTIGTDRDIFVTSSDDNGVTWTAAAALASNAATDSGLDGNPLLASDGSGNWVATWYSYDSLGGTIGSSDSDVLTSTSNSVPVELSAFTLE